MSPFFEVAGFERTFGPEEGRFGLRVTAVFDTKEEMDRFADLVRASVEGLATIEGHDVLFTDHTTPS